MISLPKAINAFSLPVWNQTNNSDINGSLYASFNIDLTENDGKLRLGRRLVANTLTSDNANLTSYPVGFRQQTQTNKNLWTVAGTKVFVQNENYPNGSGFAPDTGTNTPTDCSSTLSDIEVFNGELYVSRNSVDISYLPVASSTWSIISGAGNGSVPTPLCVYGGRLYSVAGQGIVSIDTSHVLATLGSAFTVTIPDINQLVTFIRAASDRIWIGTVAYYGGKGYVYEWDGVSTQVSKSHRLAASGALSCVIKDDIPYIMDSNGVLMNWNGGTFTELARLYRKNKRLLYNPLGLDNSRFIHPNGMSLVNNKINLLIDGRNYDNTTPVSSSIDDTIPSGIWEYDENKGLYHKHSIAMTHAANTITDYGAVKIAGVGAISEWNIPSTVAGRNGTLLCGVNYFQDVSTVKSGIFYDDSNDTLQKAGYFITPKLMSADAQGQSSVQNMWQNFYTLFKAFITSTDKIYVKYRKQEISSVIATATWTSTTTFTTPTDLSALAGYEVEVLLGIGAGKPSQIVSAVFSGGVCTVTVDETYVNATGTSQIRVQNWVKISDMDTTSQATYDQANVGILSNWIQFKLTLLFTGKDEIEKVIIINEDYNPAN